MVPGRHFVLVIFLSFECWSLSISSEGNQKRRHGHLHSDVADMRWDVWSAWSECSVDCGTGIISRSRDCRSMIDGRSVGGCVGLSEEMKVCEITGCIKEVTANAECMKLQNRKYGGKRYHWEPYKHPTKPCELACRPVEAGFFLGLGKNVSDGVACNRDGSSVCVRGECKPLGCDGVVDSGTTVDTCSVCGGDGTSCKRIVKTFTKSIKYGYETIATIPRGATNIMFTELQKSRNYLVIKSAEGSLSINTMFRLSRFGDHPGAGTLFTYNRGTGPDCPDECIRADGPTDVAITLMALMYVENKGIQYSYNIPKDTIAYVDVDEDTNPMVYIDGGSIPGTNEDVDPYDNKRPIFSYDFKFKKHNRHYKQHDNNDANDSQDDDNDGDMNNTNKTNSVGVTGETGALTNGETANRELDNDNQHESDIIRETKTGAIDLHAGEDKDTANYSATVTNTDNGETNATYSDEIATTTTTPATTTPAATTTTTATTTTATTTTATATTSVMSETTEPYIEEKEEEKEEVSPTPDSNHPGIIEDDFGGGVYLDVSDEREEQEIDESEEQETDESEEQEIDESEEQEPALLQIEKKTELNDTDGDVSIEVETAPVDTDVETDVDPAIDEEDESTSDIELDTEDDSEVDAGVNTGVNTVVNTVASDMYNNDNRIPSLYSWRKAGYTQCSQSCGQGKQSTVIECIVTDKQAKVEDTYCADQSKPESTVIVCNYGPCPPSWQPRTWSKCSVTCGLGTQVRDYVCTSSDGIEVNNYDCGSSAPRREERSCDMGSCTSGWYFTEWPTQCPASCGYGTITRGVRCFSDSGNVHTACPEGEKPSTEKSCRSDQCGGFWLTGPWSQCNATCGLAYQERAVACAQKQRDRIMVVSESACSDEERPSTYMSCDLEPCRPEWYMNEWSQCSATCESGERSRDIRCLDHNQLPSSGCDAKTKPTDREACTVNRPCPVADQSDPTPRPHQKPHDQTSERPREHPPRTDPLPANCTDKFSQCVLVLQARLCQYKYYASICCKSCSLAKKT